VSLLRAYSRSTESKVGVCTAPQHGAAAAARTRQAAVPGDAAAAAGTPVTAGTGGYALAPPPGSFAAAVAAAAAAVPGEASDRMRDRMSDRVSDRTLSLSHSLTLSLSHSLTLSLSHSLTLSLSQAHDRRRACETQQAAAAAEQRAREQQQAAAQSQAAVVVAAPPSVQQLGHKSSSYAQSVAAAARRQQAAAARPGADAAASAACEHQAAAAAAGSTRQNQEAEQQQKQEACGGDGAAVSGGLQAPAWELSHVSQVSEARSEQQQAAAGHASDRETASAGGERGREWGAACGPQGRAAKARKPVCGGDVSGGLQAPAWEPGPHPQLRAQPAPPREGRTAAQPAHGREPHSALHSALHFTAHSALLPYAAVAAAHLGESAAAAAGAAGARVAQLQHVAQQQMQAAAHAQQQLLGHAGGWLGQPGEEPDGAGGSAGSGAERRSYADLECRAGAAGPSLPPLSGADGLQARDAFGGAAAQRRRTLDAGPASLPVHHRPRQRPGSAKPPMAGAPIRGAAAPCPFAAVAAAASQPQAGAAASAPRVALQQPMPRRSLLSLPQALAAVSAPGPDYAAMSKVAAGAVGHGAAEAGGLAQLHGGSHNVVAECAYVDVARVDVAGAAVASQLQRIQASAAHAQVQQKLAVGPLMSQLKRMHDQAAQQAHSQERTPGLQRPSPSLPDDMSGAGLPGAPLLDLGAGPPTGDAPAQSKRTLPLALNAGSTHTRGQSGILVETQLVAESPRICPSHLLRAEEFHTAPSPSPKPRFALLGRASSPCVAVPAVSAASAPLPGAARLQLTITTAGPTPGAARLQLQLPGCDEDGADAEHDPFSPRDMALMLRQQGLGSAQALQPAPERSAAASPLGGCPVSIPNQGNPDRTARIVRCSSGAASALALPLAPPDATAAPCSSHVRCSSDAASALALAPPDATAPAPASYPAAHAHCSSGLGGVPTLLKDAPCVLSDAVLDLEAEAVAALAGALPQTYVAASARDASPRGGYRRRVLLVPRRG
jgi:hypothetical protein